MLGALYQRSLRLGDMMMPVMHELADQTGESMSIIRAPVTSGFCIHRVDSEHAVRDHVREGDVLPLERGSGGRILLALSGAKGEPYDPFVGNIATHRWENATPRPPAFPFPSSARPGHSWVPYLASASRIDETFIANARAVLLRAAARARMPWAATRRRSTRRSP